MKDYSHLLDKYESAGDGYYYPEHEKAVVEPPTLNLAMQLWQAARTGPTAFEEFIDSLETYPLDPILLYSLDLHGQNFLHHAATNGDPQTVWATGRLYAEQPRTCTMGLPRNEFYVDLRERLPRQRDLKGNMPLHVAASHDNLDFVKALLQWHGWGLMYKYAGIRSFPEEFYGDLSLTDGRYAVRREEYRYILPLLDFKNNAGRTAAKEARFCGAERTARWLEWYKMMYVGEEEEEALDDCSQEHFLSNRCTAS